MRRSVLMGMKTSMNMEIPSPPSMSGRRSTGGRSSSGPVTGQRTGAFPVAGSAAAARHNNGVPAKGRNRWSKAGQKRKRAKDESESSGSDSALMSGLGEDSDSEDTSSVTELPRMTQSGRTVVKPTQFVPAVSETPSRKRGPTKRNQEHALCKRCGRGHSPASNMIVFCDGCNLGWHQMCHDPAVSDEMVKDEGAAWFCADCSLKRSRKGNGTEQTRSVSWQGRSTDDVSQCSPYCSLLRLHGEFRYAMLTTLCNRNEHISLLSLTKSWSLSSYKPASYIPISQFSHRRLVRIPYRPLFLPNGPPHLNHHPKRTAAPIYTPNNPSQPLQPVAYSPALKQIPTRL